MYRVSVFDDNHFWDECWFDAYEEKELHSKDVPMSIVRYKDVDKDAWWFGECPRCKKGIHFYGWADEGNRKQYCYSCGQLVDFELA